MGVGAACVMPVTLSVITTVFPPEERGKAVGTWAGVAAGGGVLGLVTSGVLLEWLAWPSVFGLNVVLAVLALAGTLAVVPSTRGPPAAAPRPRRHAAVGAGWRRSSSASSRAPSAAGASGHASPPCVRCRGDRRRSSLWELRRDEPMLDPRNFLRRGFGAGSLSITVQFFAVFGFLFLALPYLQLVLGFSPIKAAARAAADGAARDPAVAGLAADRRTARRPRRRRRRSHADGDRLGHLRDDGRRLVVLALPAGLVPFGAGMALAGAPATTAIVASLPAEKQGVASAVNDVSRELGGALGIAVLGSLFNGAYRRAWPTRPPPFPPAPASRRSARRWPPRADRRAASGRRAHQLIAPRPDRVHGRLQPRPRAAAHRRCCSARSSSPSAHPAGRSRPLNAGGKQLSTAAVEGA